MSVPVEGSIHSWHVATGTDGPGTRLVVVTAGCSLRCVYCHNPRTWRLSAGERTTSAQVLGRLDRYAPYLRAAGGGLTVSGGEPLLQPAFTEAVLAGASDRALHTVLDTAGGLGARAGEELLAATDLVLLDIKAADPGLYRILTGGELAPTLAFAERLAALDKPTWVRFVLVPGLNDDPGHLDRLARLVAGFGNVEHVEVLGYHRTGRRAYAELGLSDPLAGIPGATPDQVRTARRALVDAGLPQARPPCLDHLACPVAPRESEGETAMLTVSTTPEVLREAVCQAVRDGAWTTADVVATVATDYAADRASVVAVLWDLVEEGFLHWDASGQIGCFAPVRSAAVGRRP